MQILEVLGTLGASKALPKCTQVGCTQAQLLILVTPEANKEY